MKALLGSFPTIPLVNISGGDEGRKSLNKKPYSEGPNGELQVAIEDLIPDAETRFISSAATNIHVAELEGKLVEMQDRISGVGDDNAAEQELKTA
jgi:hypothetical protein